MHTFFENASSLVLPNEVDDDEVQDDVGKDEVGEGPLRADGLKLAAVLGIDLQ